MLLLAVAGLFSGLVAGFIAGLAVRVGRLGQFLGGLSQGLGGLLAGRGVVPCLLAAGPVRLPGYVLGESGRGPACSGVPACSAAGCPCPGSPGWGSPASA